MSSITRGLKKLRLGRKKKGDEKSSDPKKDGPGASQQRRGSTGTAETRRIRKRLSITEADGTSNFLLDGTSNRKDRPMTTSAHMDEEKNEGAGHESVSSAYAHYAMKSKVGVVPFNPSKVNQDRAMIVETCLGRSDNGIFGVFDGHGIHGDDVSSYLKNEMPKVVEAQAGLFEKDPVEALKVVFEKSTGGLAKSNVNCTFSGSTATVSYLDKESIWTANAGDSRAVLGKKKSGSTFEAVPLSFDHKPDTPAEQARIEKHNGRVEPCKGPMGDYIGPARVWLKHQDMPGLAMSRSFGDDVATAVGVTSEADVVVHKRSPDDAYVIMGSDGIWEFISNQEAVDLVAPFYVKGNTSEQAHEASRCLSAEATKRWQDEEEVIDDITVVVVFL